MCVNCSSSLPALLPDDETTEPVYAEDVDVARIGSIDCDLMIKSSIVLNVEVNL